MKKHQIRAIVWGCGVLGRMLVRYLHEKGVELVGAIDRNASRIGKDLGEISELKKSLGIPIHHPDEAEQVFKQANANICIICTRTSIVDLYPVFEVAAKHGVNAITAGEEAFYPWTTSPELTQKLDRLAKEHNCTLTGSGFQDVFAGHLITAVAGSTHRVDRIERRIRFNFNHMGIGFAQLYGLGLSVDAFEQKITTNTDKPFISTWNVHQWLCVRLGWTIRNQKQEVAPITETKTVYSTSLSRDISAGNVTGLKVIMLTQSEEGPAIETNTEIRIYQPDEVDICEFSVIGEPNTTVALRQIDAMVLTCGPIIHRLPDLLDAPPGFLTTDKLPPPTYYPLVGVGTSGIA